MNDVRVVRIPVSSRVLAFTLEPLTLYNPRATSLYLRPFDAIEVRHNMLWPHRERASARTAPEGSYVYVEYHSGSRKHTYVRCVALFRVADVGERRYLLINAIDGTEAEFRAKNLELVADLLRLNLDELEAECRNAGFEVSRNYREMNLACWLVYRDLSRDLGRDARISAALEALRRLSRDELAVVLMRALQEGIIDTALLASLTAEW